MCTANCQAHTSVYEIRHVWVAGVVIKTCRQEFIGRRHAARGVHKNGTDIDLLVCFNAVRIYWQVTSTGGYTNNYSRPRKMRSTAGAPRNGLSSRHEIRIPVNVVAGLIDLWPSISLNPVQIEYVRSLQLTSQRLLKVVSVMNCWNSSVYVRQDRNCPTPIQLKDHAFIAFKYLEICDNIHVT